MTQSISITIPTNIPLDRIRSLLTGAFEGGSNYWMGIHSYKLPHNRKPSFYGKGSDLQPIDDWWPQYILIPTTDGTLLLEDQEEFAGEEYINDQGLYELNMAKIISGLKVFSELKPARHFANFLSEDDDAETSDVFLQCCLFGDIIYG